MVAAASSPRSTLMRIENAFAKSSLASMLSVLPWMSCGIFCRRTDSIASVTSKGIRIDPKAIPAPSLPLLREDALHREAFSAQRFSTKTQAARYMPAESSTSFFID